MRALPIEPDSNHKPIGSRIRAARLAQQLTIDNLAQATGLTKGFLSRIERDITSPSVNTLVDICEVLSIPIGSLFENTEVRIVKKGEGPHINLGGVASVEHLLTPRQEARVQLIHSEVLPGGHGGEQLYTINADVDVVHVLRGRLQVKFSDQEVVLAEGDTATFPGREPHTWSVISEDGATLLWVLSPSPWHVTP
ncbi:MAG: helix-turn-helix transcriptional regulator [Microbacteriaceae bacterium]|nr:helix-turn-helix transcriptional regulator [Microbacteriaceae bacterium]